MSDYNYEEADPAGSGAAVGSSQNGGDYLPPEDDFNTGAAPATDPAPSSYAELEEMPTELPSSSALDAFLAEWETKLEAKRAVEAEKKQERVEKARAELEKFAAEREVTREKKQSNNRKEEQVKLEKLEADLEAENPWERVINLVDMQAECPSKADMSRFKQMFIQLKNEPFATGAGAGAAAGAKSDS